MNENFWKDAYKQTWDMSSVREKRLMAHIKKWTGMECIATGLGAASSQYISGSAARNGYQKGDADLLVEGTNVYIEVTGPLVKSVKSTEPLWFRPDKLENAIKNSSHDVFLVHHCMSDDVWRVIHIDEDFKKRYREKQFQIVTPTIRGIQEKYVEIKVNDKCIQYLEYLIKYLRKIKESRTDG